MWLGLEKSLQSLREVVQGLLGLPLGCRPMRAATFAEFAGHARLGVIDRGEQGEVKMVAGADQFWEEIERRVAETSVGTSRGCWSAVAA